jgi:hypothetical protein
MTQVAPGGADVVISLILVAALPDDVDGGTQMRTARVKKSWAPSRRAVIRKHKMVEILRSA